jgi:metal-responsive CopG/Arc/MetJ family transcriptional regulator
MQTNTCQPTSLRLESQLLRRLTNASWQRRMSRSEYILKCLRVGMEVFECKQEEK